MRVDVCGQEGAGARLCKRKRVHELNWLHRGFFFKVRRGRIF